MTYRYRHFTITGHAFDRFNQRTGRVVFDLMDYLDKAVLFVPTRKTKSKIIRWYDKLIERGQYSLEHNGMLFIVDPSNGTHTVVTVIRNKGA